MFVSPYSTFSHLASILYSSLPLEPVCPQQLAPGLVGSVAIRRLVDPLILSGVSN